MYERRTASWHFCVSASLSVLYFLRILLPRIVKTLLDCINKIIIKLIASACVRKIKQGWLAKMTDFRVLTAM